MVVMQNRTAPASSLTLAEPPWAELKEGRDDIGKLPITPQAKKYARRSGLASMKRQPKDYQNMVAAELGQHYKGFPNKDASKSTSGGSIKNAIKENTADWTSFTQPKPAFATRYSTRVIKEHLDRVRAAAVGRVELTMTDLDFVASMLEDLIQYKGQSGVSEAVEQVVG